MFCQETLNLFNGQQLFIVDIWHGDGGRARHVEQSEPLEQGELDDFFESWFRDYETEGWTFVIFELTARERAYDILLSDGPKVRLI